MRKKVWTAMVPLATLCPQMGAVRVSTTDTISSVLISPIPIGLPNESDGGSRNCHNLPFGGCRRGCRRLHPAATPVPPPRAVRPDIADRGRLDIADRRHLEACPYVAVRLHLHRGQRAARGAALMARMELHRQ